ncbi:MAG: DUF3108 domain-containing protein [Hyphomicrobiaceae bacterium]
MALPAPTLARPMRRSARYLVAAIALAAGLPAVATAKAEVAPWPSAVQAAYDIHFAGIDIGNFVMTSELVGRDYKVTGNAKISIAFGAFTWRATAVSTGTAGPRGPEPARHTFQFRRNSKAGSVAMGFARGRVASLDVQPQRRPDPRRVPVEPQHLTGVYDPMSAILAVTRANGSADPCKRRIGVFDGRQRLDLEFTFKRHETIREARASGQPRKGYVCRVRYIPVAGHKKVDREVSMISGSNEIEVVLQHVPSAGLYIPAMVRVPTPAGTAALVAKAIDITTIRQERIALRH